ncbi:MAG TPA: hypothetical protein VFB12_17060 [Ktedonobacteraceae bacterium]|nr:hypothetical protein [Ktedonobacteraceae bacterium]
MLTDSNRKRLLLRVMLSGLRRGWPVFILLGILWFPFDRLSEVWPTFGVPFRQVFRTAHDHFVGHTVFFFIVGMLILNSTPVLRRQLHWYILGLIVAALVQEAIQAGFRSEVPTFTDFNAFKGDALGGMAAWLLWFGLRLLCKRRSAAKSLSGTKLG